MMGKALLVLVCITLLVHITPGICKTESSMVGVYYWIEGNGYFLPYLVTVSAETGNITKLTEIGVYGVAGPNNAPGAYDHKSRTYYNPLQTYNPSGTEVFIATPQSASSSFSYENYTLCLKFDPATSTLLALTLPSSKQSLVHIVAIAPTTELTSIVRDVNVTGFPHPRGTTPYAPSSFDDASGVFSFIGGERLQNSTLYIFDVDNNDLRIVPLKCSDVIFLHYDTSTGVYYGLRTDRRGFLYLVVLHLPSGTCEMVVQISNISTPTSSALDQQTGLLVVLYFTNSDQAYMSKIDMRNHYTVTTIKLAWPNVNGPIVGLEFL